MNRHAVTIIKPGYAYSYLAMDEDESLRKCSSMKSIKRLNCGSSKFRGRSPNGTASVADETSVTSSLFVVDTSQSRQPIKNYGLSYAFSVEPEWDFLEIPPTLDRQRFVPISRRERKAWDSKRNAQGPHPIVHPHPRRTSAPVHPLIPYESIANSSPPFPQVQSSRCDVGTAEQTIWETV